jgi:hypothetical protein
MWARIVKSSGDRGVPYTACKVACAGPIPAASPGETLEQDSFMAKPNYAFAKRQRELAKKQKKEAKKQQRSAATSPEGSEPAPPPSQEKEQA